eukprot:EG_transcript_26177
MPTRPVFNPISSRAPFSCIIVNLGSPFSSGLLPVMALQTTSGTCEPVDLWRPCIGWAVAPRSSSCARVESALIFLQISAQRGIRHLHFRWASGPSTIADGSLGTFRRPYSLCLPVAPHFVVPHISARTRSHNCIRIRNPNFTLPPPACHQVITSLP